MSAANCLITRCRLVVAERSIRGDLHEMGNVFIFNAVLREGEAAWEPGAGRGWNSNEKIIDTRDYFERRGVFVILRSGAMLNQSARDYIAKWAQP